MPLTVPTPGKKTPSPVSVGLLKVWVSQRKLLRILETQRQTAPLHDSPLAVEVVTDGYYLLRKNLFDLVALNRNLPVDAQAFPDPDPEPPGSRPPLDKNLHDILAFDLAALNALAADYAALHADTLLAGARDVAVVVQQHGRQLKAFLTNLFPEHAGT